MANLFTNRPIVGHRIVNDLIRSALSAIPYLINGTLSKLGAFLVEQGGNAIAHWPRLRDLWPGMNPPTLWVPWIFSRPHWIQSLHGIREQVAMPNLSVTTPISGDRFHPNDRDRLSQECLKLRRQNTQLNQKINAQQQKISHQTEELDALQNLKQLVMQAICHDLRTSVTGSRMVLEKLRDQIEDETQSKLINQLLAGSDRQLALIHALALDPNQNSILCQPHPQPVDLGAIATATLQKLDFIFQRHQVTVQQQMPADLPLVLAEPSQLQQVFTHLLDNVIRHNPPGTVATLTAKRLPPCPTTHQAWVQCTIQDNGVGIPTENRPCLFKPYLRCQQEIRRTGVGLGLYQCRQIIHRFHGEITLSSQLGQGTQVQFTLPIVPQSPST